MCIRSNDRQSHRIDSARPLHGIPTPAVAARGQARRTAGTETLCGPGCAAEPGPGRASNRFPALNPAQEESPHFEENVLISRGGAAPRRGDHSVVRRCAGRTCARDGRLLLPTDTGRHRRVRSHRRAASVDGLRVCACACVRFISGVHNVSSEQDAQPPSRGYRYKFFSH